MSRAFTGNWQLTTGNLFLTNSRNFANFLIAILARAWLDFGAVKVAGIVGQPQEMSRVPPFLPPSVRTSPASVGVSTSFVWARKEPFYLSGSLYPFFGRSDG